jgi:heme/copper-type cytochrome/quinol oxidase subunit 2
MLNENGLNAIWWTVSNNYKQISEGEVVGIAFGWIVAVVLFYVVGVVLILKCVPLRREETEASERKESGG